MPAPFQASDRATILQSLSANEIGSQLPIFGPRPIGPSEPIVPSAESSRDWNPSADGNLFHDKDNPNLIWYRPLIALASDEEQTFKFSVTRDHDGQGSPVYRWHLTFAFKKTVPEDVIAFQVAHPGFEFREVQPLRIINSRMNTDSIFAFIRWPNFAPLTPSSNDLLVFTLDANDAGCINLYNALKFGTDPSDWTISLFYRWYVSTPTGGIRAEIPYAAWGFGSGSGFQQMSLKRAFAAQRFQLDYTVTIGDTTRYIFSADDISGSDGGQPAFEEVTALGDVNARYPSINRLFASRIRRGITVIPSRYVILRERSSCAAACEAVLSSGPSTTSSDFQFTFTLVPDINPIELVQLVGEINARADIRGAILELPTSFNLATGSTLATSFADSIQYAAGSGTPNTIALSVKINDQPGRPAVADATLFMNQLRDLHEPFLSGTIALKLDDADPGRIDVPVLLSFKETQQGNAANEFSFHVDEANAKVTLTSASVFDLFVTQAALIGSHDTTVIAVGQIVRAGQSVSLPLPADHTGLNVLVDCELAVGLAVGDDTLSESDFFKYLRVNLVDMQQTQYLLAVNADTVNFQRRAIDRIEVTIVLTNLPTVLIPSLGLFNGHTTESTHVLVPLIEAVTQLEAQLLFAVHFVDPNRPPLQFARQNDFVQQPIFLLNDTDISN